jgi:hypothetical protein
MLAGVGGRFSYVLMKNQNNLQMMNNRITMVITKHASRVKRIRLRFPASPVVPIKALPAAPLYLIKLSEQMKPARNNCSEFKDCTAHQIRFRSEKTPKLAKCSGAL